MTTRLPQFFPPLAVWALLALITLPALARDRGDNIPPDPPPEPNPIEISIPRGPTVGIQLTAYSLTSPIIRYRIKRQPQAGRLGAPRMVDPLTAVVNYTPPPGAGPGEDSFSYQVQSLAGVSAPAEVHITITDKDPLLSVPAQLDFGQVPAGAIGRRQLVIQNVGGGIADGDIQLPEPWSVNGDTGYHLLAGEKQIFNILFRPSSLGDFTGDIAYSGDSGRATDLLGKQVAPVSITQGPIELKPAGALPEGIIQIINRTPTPQTYRITPGPRVTADAPTLDAPAYGIGVIVIRERPGQLGAIHDLVTVQGPQVNVDIPVYVPEPAPTPPPMIAAIPGDFPPQRPPPISPPSVLMRVSNDDTPPGLTLPPQPDDTGDNSTPDLTRTVSPIVVGNITRTSAQAVTIFKDTPPIHSYSLQSESIGLDDQGRPIAKWCPMLNATAAATGPRVIATMTHLQPATAYIVRIVALDDQSNIVASTLPVRVQTAPPRPPLPWRWIALAAALLVLAAWWWKTRPPRPRAISGW